MEHQSFNRTEPVPKDVEEYLTTQREIIKKLSSTAIDQVRAAGWYNYDRGSDNDT